MRTVTFLLLLIQSVFAGYGDGDDEYLSDKERQMAVLTNAVRLDPTGYRDRYLNDNSILLPQNYPAVSPVYHNRELSPAAQYHSDALADNNVMSHSYFDRT